MLHLKCHTLGLAKSNHWVDLSEILHSFPSLMGVESWQVWLMCCKWFLVPPLQVNLIAEKLKIMLHYLVSHPRVSKIKPLGGSVWNLVPIFAHDNVVFLPNLVDGPQLVPSATPTGGFDCWKVKVYVTLELSTIFFNSQTDTLELSNHALWWIFTYKVVATIYEESTVTVWKYMNGFSLRLGNGRVACLPSHILTTNPLPGREVVWLPSLQGWPV